ncbi:MAG TPA: hypothetical protein PK079_07370 [Leptospiraceae bacterium]|nr:hypothetical protein [Leptospiraceae bacterium]HMW05785.1 hypothetical protein [Leptospiraceae bacterium]HMX32626.1 hypothetical protein [Leptospiraceae bacterium]HMY33340.1 hypothetical protein [Leptospiraceae bacterium]HMZ66214.1 hypothetical protein [Leptospiraceae bacterium]
MNFALFTIYWYKDISFTSFRAGLSLLRISKCNSENALLSLTYEEWLDMPRKFLTLSFLWFKFDFYFYEGHWHTISIYDYHKLSLTPCKPMR